LIDLSRGWRWKQQEFERVVIEPVRQRPTQPCQTGAAHIAYNAEMMEEVFDTMLERVRSDAGATATDRRVATAIYRIAVMDALMSLVRFADPD
jgi:hypothetical protein